MDLPNTPDKIKQQVEAFIKDIHKIPYFKPDGKPDKAWKIFYGDSWDAARNAARDAAWDATRDAEWKAARDAAWDAEWNAARNAARDAEWDATRDAAKAAAWKAAWDAARAAAKAAAWKAAWDAAWKAAWDAARAAARGAEWDAAWDAALQARMILTSDLKFKDAEKHRLHVKARMNVWLKGYGLLCDINGTLYVYCKKEKAKS